MKTLKEYKEQQMQDLEFAKGYEAIQPELEVIRKRNDTRIVFFFFELLL